MTWKRFTIFISSIAAVVGAVKLVQACAGGEPDPYDEYPTFFFNTINNEPAYTPFYYTSLLAFYNDDYNWKEWNKGISELSDANIAEWFSAYGKGVKSADIDSVIYTYPYEYIQGAYMSVTQRTPTALPPRAKNNSFIQSLMKRKDKNTLQYIMFAKQCETATAPIESHWDEAKSSWVYPTNSVDTANRLIAEGAGLQRFASNDFLKWRYAYQVLRVSFCSGQYERTLKLYDSLIGDRTAKNVMYPRCLELKAGACYKLRQHDTAAYLYSKVFDMSDERKKASFTSFRWSAGYDINDELKLCVNDHERAVMHVMKTLYIDENTDMLEQIIKAYTYDPKVKGLEVAVTREINKTEESYMTPEYRLPAALDPQRNNPAKTQAYLGSLAAFAEKVATEKKRGNVTYWHLAAAYAYYMQGDLDRCKQLLATAKAGGAITRTEQDVHDVMSILCILRKDEKITAVTEAAVLPYLKNAERLAANDRRFNKVYSDLLVSVMAPQYLRQGDTISAIYALSRSANPKSPQIIYDGGFTYAPAGVLLESMTPAGLREVQAFVSKPGKTPYEQWLVRNSDFTVDVLKELEGTKYIRQMEFGKAARVLQQTYSSGYLPDFLVSHIDDRSAWNRSDSAHTYDKLEFAQKMDELQQKLKRNPKDARAAYQYANGLYSMSYYGKSHEAYDYYRSTTDEFGYYTSPSREVLPFWAREYYDVKIALENYMIAYENSTDKEMKARCLFMAAKCWQKSTPEPKGHSAYLPDEGDYYWMSLKNPYFKTLKDYKNTHFYSSAYNTCSYFKDYADRKW